MVQQSKQVLITAHRSPDGDAIGSSLGMYHFLKQLGVNVKVMVPDDYPEFLQWMPGNDQVMIFDRDPELAKATIEASDLIFALDYNILNRTGSMTESLEQSEAPFILIDHHQQPGGFPEIAFSDTSACSTAQMVFDFIDFSGNSNLVNAELGTCLYCGIMTDTGSFRFPSVSARTHYIAAKLIEAGVDHAEIHRKVYDTNLLDRLRLIGYALKDKLEVMPEFHTAIISLTEEELTRFNYRPGDTESLVNQALSIHGVNFAIFVREGTNVVKMSFRSQGTFNVNEFARSHFKGGGHTNAAGGVSYDKVDVTLDKLKKLLPFYREALSYEL